MANRPRKPALFPSGMFSGFVGGDDPAQLMAVAHETARALLSRVRADPDPIVIEALVTYTDHHDIDAIAELWARSGAETLPGALWRLYLLRVLIRHDPESLALFYQSGAEILSTIDPVIAGIPLPSGPVEVMELADQVLRGVFEGDFAIALERAAALCRVTAAGCLSVAEDQESVNPERARELTTRADRFIVTAEELRACARLWRADSLD